jgi:hypothetical protein
MNHHTLLKQTLLFPEKGKQSCMRSMFYLLEWQKLLTLATLKVGMKWSKWTSCALLVWHVLLCQHLPQCSVCPQSSALLGAQLRERVHTCASSHSQGVKSVLLWEMTMGSCSK